jgi:glycosyltransferase involved in cell wall biosynthesis
MQKTSASHLVLIPSYNPGARVFDTVRAARSVWGPVWVVVDGSDDGSTDQLLRMAQEDPALEVLVLQKNGGKGGAVLAGLEQAAARGFTHVLTMDADGQHPVGLIASFMQASQADPAAMILGQPLFDANAPRLRVNGRKVSNSIVSVETLWSGVADSLFGFRVYPVEPLRRIMQRQRWMRRFDFDPEAVVRLCWHGVRPVNLAAPVTYFDRDDGGVSHFHYLRDNVLLSWMHTRLLCGMLLRLPVLLWRRLSAG